MAGVDQFNLIGDQRLVNGQSLKLGALENETRGGIARVKLGEVSPGATGFSLSATQILDSTFLTFGIGSALNATDTASAEAGFAEEDKKTTSNNKANNQNNNQNNNQGNNQTTTRGTRLRRMMTAASTGKAARLTTSSTRSRLSTVQAINRVLQSFRLPEQWHSPIPTMTPRR